MKKQTNYKKAFNTLDNLYNTLFCSYQSVVNEYNLCKEDELNEIDEIYESLIEKMKKENKNEKI